MFENKKKNQIPADQPVGQENPSAEKTLGKTAQDTKTEVASADNIAL